MKSLKKYTEFEAKKKKDMGEKTMKAIANHNIIKKWNEQASGFIKIGPLR